MVTFSLHRADRAALLALLMLLLWVLPFGVLSWLVGSGRVDAWEEQGGHFRAWCMAALAAGMLVGVWLGLQLFRACIWRRRRNPRPSREIQAERQRIARALHDTVGSQLVNASMLLDSADARQSQVRAVLDHCLLDLRLLVDSMDADGSGLIDRLAILRHRLQPVLERRGMALHWRVPDSSQPGLPIGEPAQHIAAIAQEALSNALQHAAAAQLEVTLAQQQGAWHLRIQDDGVGMPQQGAGKGLGTMAGRAVLAGGSLQCTAGLHGRGVCIHLHWPVGRGPG